MEREWISGFGGPWHIAERKELRTPKTNELLHVFTVTACRKQQIGGAWGPRKRKGFPGQPICQHCAKIAAKGTTHE